MRVMEIETFTANKAVQRSKSRSGTRISNKEDTIEQMPNPVNCKPRIGNTCRPFLCGGGIYIYRSDFP